MTDEQDQIEKETEEVKAPVEDEAEKYKASWQRALADYQNLQKEIFARRQEWFEMSEQQIIEEFIPVYDHFKKAFGHKEQVTMNKEQESWVNGIGHIMKQFGDILKRHKVEEVKTVGEKFDPSIHESVGELEVEGKEHGKIVKEVDGGYKMGGRVIKAARVIIAK